MANIVNKYWGYVYQHNKRSKEKSKVRSSRNLKWPFCQTNFVLIRINCIISVVNHNGSSITKKVYIFGWRRGYAITLEYLFQKSNHIINYHMVSRKWDGFIRLSTIVLWKMMEYFINKDRTSILWCQNIVLVTSTIWVRK